MVHVSSYFKTKKQTLIPFLAFSSLKKSNNYIIRCPDRVVFIVVTVVFGFLLSNSPRSDM
jgi:hypothetical protein